MSAGGEDDGEPLRLKGGGGGDTDDARIALALASAPVSFFPRAHAPHAHGVDQSCQA